MKKMMDFPIKGYLVWLFILSLLGIINADGIVVKTYKSVQKLQFVGEKKQLAFINHSNGVEKLILSISTDTSESNAIWIFPIPAPPSSVKLEILRILPDFRGYDILSHVRDKLLTNLLALTLASQIYPIFYIFFATYREIQKEIKAGSGNFQMQSREVTVHEHLEKGKVILEKINASDARVFYKYLQKKGLNINKGIIPMLDYYLGKDFTFIVSWISQTSTQEENAEGIYVKFPSPQIYYPLLLSSAYGDKVISTNIYVIGYYIPQIPPSLKPYATIDYYKARDFMPSFLKILSGKEEEEYERDKSLINEFLIKTSHEESFTLVKIQSPAKNYTTDLIMTPGAPPKLYFALFLLKYSFLWGPLLYLLLSCFASLLAGIFTLGRLSNQPLLFLALGLFNFFGIIGMAIAVISLNLEKKNFTVSLESDGSFQMGISPSTQISLPSSRPKWIYLLTFSIFFLTLSTISIRLLAIPFRSY